MFYWNVKNHKFTKTGSTFSSDSRTSDLTSCANKAWKLSIEVSRSCEIRKICLTHWRNVTCVALSPSKYTVDVSSKQLYKHTLLGRYDGDITWRLLVSSSSICMIMFYVLSTTAESRWEALTLISAAAAAAGQTLLSPSSSSPLHRLFN